MKVLILLNTIDKVRDFTSKIMMIDGDYDIVSQGGHYTVDAKSILGIFSLDLSKPVLFQNAQHSDLSEEVLNLIAPFRA